MRKGSMMAEAVRVQTARLGKPFEDRLDPFAAYKHARGPQNNSSPPASSQLGEKGRESRPAGSCSYEANLPIDSGRNVVALGLKPLGRAEPDTEGWARQRVRTEPLTLPWAAPAS